MKKLLLASIASLVATTSPALADPAMWRVSDADSEIILFGSVHVLRPETQWRTDQLDTALQTADEVYYETPMTAAAMANVAALLPSFAVNAPGEPLSSWLTDEQNIQLDRVARGIGASGAVLEPYRPWFAGVQLSIGYVQMSGYSPTSGVETVLSNITDDERERYFESYEDQFGFFAGLSRETETDFLVQSLDQIENDPDMLDTMVDAWADGDLAVLNDIFHTGMKAAGPELYDVLIVRRNTHWVDEIETMMAGSGETLIVVGAGHLVGEDGVPAMLTARGYTVERIQ